jgi:hypothetical protein
VQAPVKFATTTKQSGDKSLAATKSLENRLTVDEIAKRLSSLGRILREG